MITELGPLFEASYVTELVPLKLVITEPGPLFEASRVTELAPLRLLVIIELGPLFEPGPLFKLGPLSESSYFTELVPLN